MYRPKIVILTAIIICLCLSSLPAKAQVSTSDNAKITQEWLRRADSSLQKDQIQDAFYYYELARVYDPQGFIGKSLAAYVAKELNWYGIAIGYCKELYEQSHSNAVVSSNLAGIYGQMGEFKQANYYLNKALDKNPDDIYTITNMLALNNDPEQASHLLQVARLALSNDTNHVLTPVIYNNMSNLFESINQHDSALVYVDKALELNSESIDAILTKVDLIGKNNDQFSELNKRVVRIESERLKQNPIALQSLINRAGAYRNLAQDTHAQADMSRALAILDRLIELHPDASRFWLRRARIHESRGNHQLAMTDYRKVLSLDPTNISALEYLNKKD